MGARLAGLTAGLALATALAGAAAGRGQEDNRHEVTIRARDGAFDPARVDVRLNELVSIVFVAEDGPHALYIDEYRIAKRASPGSPARVQFRADRAGSFPYYCTLTGPDGQVHDVRGELVVHR